MIKLHNSKDRVKKFLPGVLNLLSKSTKEYLRNEYFQRFKVEKMLLFYLN